MGRIRCRIGVAMLFVLSSARVSFAQNTTSDTAIDLVPGQIYHIASVDGTTQRWFRIQPAGGRSYCVQAVAAPTEDNSAGVLPIVTITSADGLTALYTSYALSEPLCWAPATFAQAFIKVEPSLPQSVTYVVRLVETTLYSNWFFVGGDYSAFTLLRNTTISPVSYVINWRNSAGLIIGTHGGTLAGNGSTYVDARNVPGALAAGSGTVEIVHLGSVDAIVATTTVLSPTTGLSFDTVFVKRTTW